MMTKKTLNKELMEINNKLFAAKAENTLQFIYEKELAAALGLVFQKMKEEVLKNLEEYYSPEVMLKAHMDLILSPIHEYHRLYYETIEKYILREYKKGKSQGKRLVSNAKQYAKNYSRLTGAVKADTKTFHAKAIINKGKLFGTSDFSAEHMTNKTFVASEKTLARVDKDINGIITEGYRDGKGINDVGNRIEKRFNQFKTWEANRIARTEIHGSHMQGVLQSYQDMDVQYIQWAAAHDSRVRDTHADLDGEIILMGATFSNGLKYPGDTTGKLSEFINCRCGAIPWFCPPGYAVPNGMTRFRESDLIVTLDKWQAYDELTQPTTMPENITPNEEIISTGDLLWGVHENSWEINAKKEGFEIINGNVYYKGLKVSKYDFDNDIGYIYKHEIDAHNKKIIYKGFKSPTGNQLSELSVEDINDYNDLKEQIQWAIDVQTSNVVTPQGKTMAIEKLDDLLLKLKRWNKKITGTSSTDSFVGEYINPDDLWMAANDENHIGDYLIDVLDGPIIKNPKTGKHEFKGLELHDYDPNYGHGYVSHEQVLAHNKKVKKMRYTSQKKYIDTNELVESKSPSHKGEYIIDSTDGAIIKNPKTGKYEFNGVEMTKYYPEQDLGFVSKESIKKHNLKLDNKPKSVTPSKESEFTDEYISTSNLLYDDYFGEYKIPKTEFKYNPNTQKYEYKGLQIDMQQYIDSPHLVYIKKADLDKHNAKFKVKFKSDDVELTWEDVEKLEIDPYGDYMIDDTHRVIFNEETGSWEYKKVPLFEYDEYEHYGIIDADEMKQYMKKHDITPPSTNKYFNTKVLQEKEIDGQKYVVDNSGKKWVIDTDRDYEYNQDILQNKGGVYSDYEKKSVAHWGRYGHQQISNLIYGDSKYSDWYKYGQIMEEQLTPLLNKMKDKYKTIHKYVDIDPKISMDAIKDYQKLEKKFEKIVNTIRDDEVKNVLWEIKDIDAAIVKTPRLAQDTAFMRYGSFDEDMVVGGTYDFDGFLSTSYDDITMPPDATSHFAEKPHRWKMIILAPKGTEGIRLNDYFNALTTEREWLLPRNYKFKVLERGVTSDIYNPQRNTVVIELLPK